MAESSVVAGDELSDINIDIEPPQLPQKRKEKVLAGRTASEVERLARKDQRRKARRHAQYEDWRAARQKLLDSMTADEQKAYWAQQQALLDAKHQMQLERKRVLQEAVERGQRIVVDLSFEDVHNEKALNSLAKQVGYAYSFIKKAPNPCGLHLTSFTGRVASVLRGYGATGWAAAFHEQPLHDVFPASDLVYLTPDSPNVLGQLDPTKVYVIGGIVDRRVNKCLSLERAGSLGVSTVRLPLDELTYRARVLNIDVVIRMLLEVLEHGDWTKAAQNTIPARRIRLVKGSGPRSNANSDSDSDSETEEQKVDQDAPTANEQEHEGQKVDQDAQIVNEPEQRIDGQEQKVE